MDYPKDLALHVAGQWRGAQGRETLPVLNPATGQSLARLPVSTAADIDDAIAAADAAFPAWAALGPWQREGILRRASALINERRQHIATLLTLENGKPLADSLGELDRVTETLAFCAEEGKRAYGRMMPPRAAGLEQFHAKRPIGPVGAFVPWNFPAVLAIRKVAAALAAGCTVVLKPAEECPASCIELVRAFADAGLPAGVLNLLFGVPAQISERIIDSEAIRKISFTGSVAIGRLLAARAGQRLKPATMELGGHAPVVIFDDVDPARVAAACVAFKFRNAGQVCLSPSRFYVHERILPAFTEHFTAAAQAIKVGHGLESGVQMGPLNNVRRRDTAERLVQDAVDRGARVVAGGRRLGAQGYFYAPTLLADLDPASQLLGEEPFCPIAPLMPWSDLDDVLARANATPFGLAAYAFTNRLDRANAFAERVQAGWIGINNFTPALADAAIGGLKDSGLGYEGGPEGLDAYMPARFVSRSNLPT